MLAVTVFLCTLLLPCSHGRDLSTDVGGEDRVMLLNNAELPTKEQDEELCQHSVCQYLPPNVSKLLKSRSFFSLHDVQPPVPLNFQNRLGQQQLDYKFGLVQIQGSISTSTPSIVVVATIPNPADPVLGTIVGKEGTVEKTVLDGSTSVIIKLYLRVTISGLYGRLTVGSDTTEGALAMWPSVLDLKPGPGIAVSTTADSAKKALNITLRDPVSQNALPIQIYEIPNVLSKNAWDTDENSTLIMESSDIIIFSADPINIIYKCSDDFGRVRGTILPGQPFFLPAGCWYNMAMETKSNGFSGGFWFTYT